ncbi:MAG: CYTH domain-containing protein [Parachlamydiaceae bacterium]|nr:CYTH domain-containing protein [Parachlamydiaceae bacterium]
MKTIEVEKKVALDQNQIKKIAQKAQLVQEILIHDSYFDTIEYHYTSQNIWLRRREGIFELKVKVKKREDLVDIYEEITNEKSLLEQLGLDMLGDLPTTLCQNKIFPFCNFVTQRKSYQVGELKIDIDEADFGDLRYRVAEIEMIVSSLDKVEDAEQKITQFINELEINTSIPVTGKLTYYLYCRRPGHYQTLVHNKVILPITEEHIQNFM